MAGRVTALRGGANFKAEMIGLKDLRVTLRDLLAGVANESDLSGGERNAVIQEAKKRLQDGLGEAAAIIRDTARTNASASKWSAAVVRAIFKYSDLKESERKGQRGALAGVRTGAGRMGRAPQLRSGPRMGNRVDKSGLFVEWNAGYQYGPRRKGKGRITATAGRLIGMSLGRIMETGTKKNTATHAFQRAVRARRGDVLRRTAESYSAAVRFIAARHGKVAA